MSYFDLGPSQAADEARYTPKPLPTFSDFFSTTLNEQMRASNFDAHIFNAYEAYNATNDRIKAATGEMLPNPFAADQGAAASAKALFAFSREAQGRLDPVQAWQQRLTEVRAAHPDKLDWDVIAGDPERQTWDAMKSARERSETDSQTIGLKTGADVPGIGSIPVVGPLLGALPALGYNLATSPRYTLTQLAASFAGQMTSPADAAVNLISFGVGGAAKSLVKNAAQNALANAAGQALLSGPKQLSYESAGLPHGWRVWADEVAGAAGGGFAVDFGARGLGRTAIAKFGRDVAPNETLSRNTERGGVLSDVTIEKEIANRLGVSAETIEKMRNGDVAASREVLEKTGAAHDPETKFALEHYETVGKLSEESLVVLEKMGVARADGMKMMANAIAGRMALELPEPITKPQQMPMADEGARLHGEASVEQHLSRLPAVIADAVRDGLEAGMPKVVEAVRAWRPETPVERLANAMDARTLAETRIHGGRASPVEVASYIRKFPGMIDESMPVESQHVEQGRSIARLDDHAFADVVAGKVAPEVAALIAENVPKDSQARVMRDVIKAAPRNMAEASEAIDRLTPQLRSAARPAGKGLSEPGGAEAQAHIEALKKETADAYEMAVGPLRERDALEQRIEDVRGEIAKLEMDPARAEAEAQAGAEFSDPTTGRAMSRDEVNSIRDAWSFAREMRKTPQPRSLIEYLRQHGGVIDETGDIKHRLGENRQRPGLISQHGLDPDRATLIAWEAGYLGSGERPGINALYDAIGEDVSGNRVYSERDADLAENHRLAAEMEQELDQHGLGRTRTEQQIFRHFSRASEEGSGTSEAIARRADIAAKRKELGKLERDFKKMIAPKEPDADASPLARDLEDADRLSQMATLIEACR